MLRASFVKLPYEISDPIFMSRTHLRMTLARKLKLRMRVSQCCVGSFDPPLVSGTYLRMLAMRVLDLATGFGRGRLMSQSGVMKLAL